MMEQDHVYRRTCTCAACQTTSLALQRSSSGTADKQPGDQWLCKNTVTAEHNPQPIPGHTERHTGSGRSHVITLPNSISNGVTAQQVLQLAAPGGPPTVHHSSSPRAGGGFAPFSTCGSSTLLPPAPGQPSAALLAAAEAALGSVQLDAALLLACLASPAATPRNTAGAGPTTAAGLKAAALKAAKGGSSSSSSVGQAAGSCGMEMVKSPAGSSRPSSCAP
jgi:hypothetical protein